MRNKNIFLFGLVAVATLALPASLRAQPEIDIRRDIWIPGTLKPIPISLSGFSGAPMRPC